MNMRGVNSVIGFVVLGAAMVVVALYVGEQNALTCGNRTCSFNNPPDAVALVALVGLATAGLALAMVVANLALALVRRRRRH
jgi:fructose-specific phosphotransferase system IIC component